MNRSDDAAYGMIDDYFDGRLDDVHEQVLFSRLSQDVELRRHYRQLRVLHERMRAGVVAPPPAMRDAALAAAFASSAPSSAAGLPWSHSLVVPGLGILVGIVLGLVPSWQGAVGEGRIAARTQAALPVAMTPPAVMTLTAPPIVARQSAETTRRTAPAPVVTVRTHDEVVATPQVPPLVPTPVPTEAPAPVATARTVEPPPAANVPVPTVAMADMVDMHDRTALGAAEPPVADAWRLELRSFTMASTPSFPLPGLISPAINNVSVGIRRMIGGHASVVVEVGQENLLQRYQWQNAGATEYVDQNFLAFWAAVGYQVDGGTLFGVDLLQSYFRASLGGTMVGPMGRGAAGLSFTIPDTRLALTFGAEGSVFLYGQQGSLFATMKYGLTGGLSVGF